MQADPRDDFGIFQGHEHMFFGLSDPYGMIREETTRILGEQVPGTRVESIRTLGEPNWLTLGRKQPDDPERVVVGHFAFCFRCHLSVATPTDAQVLDATLTFMFCNVDIPGEQKLRVDLSLRDDAGPAFDPEQFQRRFLEFRAQFD